MPCWWRAERSEAGKEALVQSDNLRDCELETSSHRRAKDEPAHAARLSKWPGLIRRAEPHDIPRGTRRSIRSNGEFPAELSDRQRRRTLDSELPSLPLWSSAIKRRSTANHRRAVVVVVRAARLPRWTLSPALAGGGAGFGSIGIGLQNGPPPNKPFKLTPSRCALSRSLTARYTSFGKTKAPE
jgi:hypothetical protein